MLVKGTNTIKITGASFCGGTTNNVTLVLTYTPGVSNVPGNGVSTQIPGISYQTYNSPQSTAGVLINPKSQTKSSEKKAPLKQQIKNLLHANSDMVKQSYDILAVLLIIGGGTLLILSLGLSGFFIERKVKLSAIHWKMLSGGFFIIVVGILLFILMA
jgi:hypothetical protein